MFEQVFEQVSNTWAIKDWESCGRLPEPLFGTVIHSLVTGDSVITIYEMSSCSQAGMGRGSPLYKTTNSIKTITTYAQQHVIKPLSVYTISLYILHVLTLQDPAFLKSGLYV